MKRDMDLIRKIVLAVEDHPHGFAPPQLTIDGYTEEQVGYHVYLLNEAGLLYAHDVISSGDPSPTALPSHLSWQGHDFAAEIRSDTVWSKTKAGIQKVGTASLPIWRELATSVIKGTVGLP